MVKTSSLGVAFDTQGFPRMFKTVKEAELAQKHYSILIRRKLEPGKTFEDPYEGMTSLPGDVSRYFDVEKVIMSGFDTKFIMVPIVARNQLYIGKRTVVDNYFNLADTVVTFKKKVDKKILISNKTVKFATTPEEAKKTGNPLYSDYFSVKFTGKNVPYLYFDCKELEVPAADLDVSLEMKIYRNTECCG